MRFVSWNLNHRALPRAIPEWVVPALAYQEPDVVVLTEYVEGPGHTVFVEELANIGLETAFSTRYVKGQNQILIATRGSLRPGSLEAPPMTPAVPPNFLHVGLDEGLDVVGFRMPAFTGAERPVKRQVWEWLISALAPLRDKPAIILGDFNTAPGDSRAYCGDCLDAFIASGWRHVLPTSGYSWRHAQSGTERRIDHAFVTGGLIARAEYSWDFRQLAGSDSTRVGLPDHAMLIASVSQ